jgi:hypothetical protein
VRFTGFVGAADDRERLRRAAAALPGVGRVEADITLRPWPQCEVYLSFAEALAAQGVRAALRDAGPSGDATVQVLRAGDSLAIEVTTPPWPAYLYVTYLQANGEAVHLNWPRGTSAAALPPGSRVVLGGGAAGQPNWRIGPPYGDEMVVVVASASPLFLGPMPASATEREYLTSFRRAFLTRPQGGTGQRTVSAVALPLQTQPR